MNISRGRRTIANADSGRGHIVFAAVMALGFGVTACSGDTVIIGSDGGVVDSGGRKDSGDAPGSGGKVGSGGAQGSGGKVGSGGAQGSGGKVGSGGAQGSGGKVGSGGAPGSGGKVGSGGAPGSGGKVGSGGAPGSGGIVGSGGAPGSGGAGGSGGATVTIPGKGCTPPAAYGNLFVSLSGHTQAEVDAKISAAWSSLFNPKGSGTIYYDGPGASESYVEDIYNNDVRSEGMSYGMMIALQLNHQTEFDRLWTWVKNHMAQGTGQIAWSCTTSGAKNSTGGAPDGEEYFATALIFASKRWGNSSGKFNYASEAQWVLNVIRTQYFNSSYHLVQFIAGSNNTDPSYILPAFYQVWACFDTANASFWNSAITAGRSFFHNAIDANGVMGDQASFTGQTTKAPGSDTIRCVMNIMADHNFFNVDAWQADTYAPKYGAYESTHASGTAQISCNALLGFGLPAATGKAFVDKLWSAPIPNHDYWNGVLYMLTLLHVSGNFQLWY